MQVVERIFKELLGRYNFGPDIAESYWKEISDAYSRKGRYYHTLKHLEDLIDEITSCPEINDLDTVLFSVFYHDIVYNVFNSDNEAQSAVIAGQRLDSMHVREEVIVKCKAQILATKDHAWSDDSDTNYFTDADLLSSAVCGQNMKSIKTRSEKSTAFIQRVCTIREESKFSVVFLL